MYLLRYRNSN